jgi:hypothetical protein
LAHPEGYRCKLDRRDWDGIGTFLMENDPYDHLRSIHNRGVIYPDRLWMTHVSYQHPNTFSLLMMLKNQYGRKPVIAEEYQYEGNLSYGWGNLTGMQETQRHLLAFMAGGYATHGECFAINGNRKDIFWTYGGQMTGQSAPRIGYFRKLVESMQFNRLCPDLTLGDGMTRFALRDGYKTLFFLYLPECPEKDRYFGLGFTDGKRHKYSARIYDVWDMKVVRALNCVDATFEAIPLNADGLVCVKLEEIGSL